MNEEKTTTKFEEEPKHFALYGASESGRDYNTVDMSRLRMYNEYLAPYRAAVDAGAGFVVVLTGKVLTMPGLPKVPAAEGIDYDEKEERITGLF